MSVFGVSSLAECRKALIGGLVAAGPLLRGDLADGALSQTEIGGLVAAFVSGVVLVFVVPNRGATRPTSSTGSSTAATDPGPSSLY